MQYGFLLGLMFALSFITPSGRPRTAAPWDGSESLLSVVYSFSPLGPTDIDVGGAELTIAAPTNMSDGHRHRRLRSDWFGVFAVFSPGIPWRQPSGRSTIQDLSPGCFLGTTAYGWLDGARHRCHVRLHAGQSVPPLAATVTNAEALSAIVVVGMSALYTAI